MIGRQLELDASKGMLEMQRHTAGTLTGFVLVGREGIDELLQITALSGGDIITTECRRQVGTSKLRTAGS